MTIARAVHFVVVGDKRPSGGINVIAETAVRLAQSGRCAGLCFPSPDHLHPYLRNDVSVAFDRNLLREMHALRGKKSRRKRLENLLSAASLRGSGNGDGDRAKIGAEDLIVLPEYCYHWAARAYPDNPKVVLAQDVFGVFRSFTTDVRRGFGAWESVSAVLTTSEAGADAIKLLPPKFHGAYRLSLDPEAFSYSEKKKMQIALVPAKRPDEARMFEALASIHPVLKDVPVVSINKMPQAELEQTLRDSLVFLSLSRDEGFGLPPAEAMACGCLVVGYTGVGGNEYLTPETGFPVADSDLAGLVATTARVIEEYRSDPAQLDARRRDASAFIAEKYAPKLATSELLATWTALEEHIYRL